MPILRVDLHEARVSVTLGTNKSNEEYRRITADSIAATTEGDCLVVNYAVNMSDVIKTYDPVKRTTNDELVSVESRFRIVHSGHYTIFESA